MTPAEAIKRLLAALPICETDVRWGMARNVNTQVEVLVVLAEDLDEEVLWDVAENVNTPVEVLVVLAKDQDAGVRAGVAENVNTPVEVLVLVAEASLDDLKYA